MRRLWVRLALAFVAVAVAGGVAAYFVGAVVGHDAVRRGLRLGPTSGRGRGAADATTENTDAFDDALREALLWGLVAAVIIGIVIAIVVSRYLSRPVEDMQDGTRRMARGDYAVRVATGGPDEIASLGEDINRLAGSLEAIETQRTRLLSELAHELRSPLTAIDGYVEGLLDDVFEPTPAVFASIGEETARLRRLAGDLTTVARAEEGAIEYTWTDLDLNAVATSVVDRLQPQFDASGVAIDASIPPEATIIHGDRDRLNQAITNLVGNGLGHVQEGGHVSVSVERDGDRALLSVQDDGDGLAAEELDRVFERFYRVPGTSRTGSGLGLTIARAIVKAHGGDVVAASAGRGRGATFTVTIRDRT